MAFTDLKLTNQAVSKLSGNVNNSDDPVTFSITSGDGNLKFPATAGGKNFKVFLINSSKQYEILNVTSRTGDSMTAARAQEGTTKLAFTIGDAVEARFTAGNIDDLITQLLTFITATATNLTVTGSLTLTGASVNILPLNLEISMFQVTIPTGWGLRANNDDRVPINRDTNTVAGGTGGQWAISGLTNPAHPHTDTLAVDAVVDDRPYQGAPPAISLAPSNHAHGLSGTVDGGGATTVASTGAWRPLYIYNYRAYRTV